MITRIFLLLCHPPTPKERTEVEAFIRELTGTNWMPFLMPLSSLFGLGANNVRHKHWWGYNIDIEFLKLKRELFS